MVALVEIALAAVTLAQDPASAPAALPDITTAIGAIGTASGWLALIAREVWAVWRSAGKPVSEPVPAPDATAAAEITRLTNEAARLHDEAASLHAQIAEMEDAAEKQKAALLIGRRALRDELTAFFGKLEKSPELRRLIDVIIENSDVHRNRPG